MKYFLLLLYCLTTYNCLALVTEHNKWNYFEGKLYGKEIRLAIFLAGNGEVNGDYSFKGNDHKLPR